MTSIEWYRVYHGMPEDAKLKVIAKRSQQLMTHVVTVWLCVLDAASRHKTRGTVQVDSEQIAVASLAAWWRPFADCPAGAAAWGHRQRARRPARTRADARRGDSGYQKYEADCELCHSSFDKEQQPQLCLDCHKEVAADVSGKRGFHGRQAETRCKQCHSDHLGVDASSVKLDEASFDHLQADFVLTGKHVGANCEGCHAAGKKHREASSECVDCHRKDDRHETRLGQKCGECHVADAWTTVEKFDHARTEFKFHL